MSKKLKSNITSLEAQKLFNEIKNDKYPVQSRGKELLDLIDRDKLNKKELKELDDTYADIDAKNRKIALDIFNEQIKSNGKTDELGVPTSIGLVKALEKARQSFMSNPIPYSLLEIIENGNSDVSREEAEAILAGLVQDKADEDWNAITLFFQEIGNKIGSRIQEVIRDNEIIAKDSVVRQKTKPKATDEETKLLINRNKAIRKRFFDLTNVYKSKQAFEILEREYNLKYSTLRTIVYKPKHK